MAQFGCSASTSVEAEESVAEAQQQLVNTDEFLYWRCNATSWAADESTRLKSTGVPGVVSLTYNVTVPWMVQNDQCILLRTNQLDGWGSSNATFTDRNPSVALSVPASDTFVSGGQNLNVHYPAPGAYTLTVDWNAKTFKIASATPKIINIVGHVSTPTSDTTVPPASLPAITINLGGDRTQSMVTDANGNYRFQVPEGSYTVTAVGPSGSTLLPLSRVKAPQSNPVASLPGISFDTTQDFTCSGTCVAPSNIDPARELVITDERVVGSARTSNAGATPGPWSFRGLIEQMAPVGTDPADFVVAWAGQFAATTINGFSVTARDISLLNWPIAANGKPDLSRAPFRLLAIVNREDVGAQGAGEGRFVFGALDPVGRLSPMTVIFEYGLPTADANGAPLTRKDWAAKFHALSAQTLGSEEYNAALQAVTDLFTRRNTSPGKPGGSSINQVRSNEILLGSPWELREFHLTNVNGSLGLRLAVTGNTPAEAAKVAGSSANQALVDFINKNSVLLQGGYATFPASTQGGEAFEDGTSWGQFLSGVEPRALHSFAGMTCNGCHNSEVGGQNLDSFYMISPLANPGNDGTGRLSPFVKNFEIPRRKAMMQNLLTCSGIGCSAGAEGMLTQ